MDQPRVPPVWFDYSRSGDFRVRSTEDEPLPQFILPVRWRLARRLS